MTAFDLLDRNRGEIEKLCREYGVARLRVFGSAVTGKWNPDTSDIDFLADFSTPPDGVDLFQQQFGLIVKLESLLGHRVDLVDWNAAKKPLFRQLAESSAVDWYAA